MNGVAALTAVLVALGPAHSARDLGEDVEVLEDPGGRLTLDDVTAGEAAAGFRRTSGHPIALGFSSSVYWFRVDLDLPAADSGWLLQLATSQLDRVDIHVRPDGAAWRVTRTGDLRPASARDVDHRHFVVRLPAGRSQVVLRVSTAGAITVPLRVVRADRFWREDGTDQLAWGFYFAFLTAMALYNGFLWTLTRDRSYLFYVGYLASFVMFQAALSGHAALHLWPGLPAWGNVAPVWFLGAGLAAVFLFVRRMADVGTTAPALHRPMAIVAAAFAAAPVFTLIDFRVTVRLISVASGVGLASLTVPIAIAVRRGWRPARWLAVAYAAILPGGLVFVLRYRGVVADTVWTRYALQVSTGMEAMLLSFALADRINLLTRERSDAQSRLLDAQEAERRRVAHDLHDGLGQSLLALTNRLRREVKREGEGSSLAPLADDARTLVGELRRIAHDLHPAHLDRLGLTEALRTTAEQTLEPAGVAVECRIDPLDGLLPATAELHLYRIAQEAVANIVRHAGATSAVVALEHHGPRCVLLIEDDGRGLPDAPADGLGLVGMRERAGLLGATISLGPARPGPGDRPGLRVRVELPVAARGRR